MKELNARQRHAVAEAVKAAREFMAENPDCELIELRLCRDDESELQRRGWGSLDEQRAALLAVADELKGECAVVIVPAGGLGVEAAALAHETVLPQGQRQKH